MDYVAQESLTSHCATLSQLAASSLHPTLASLGMTQSQFDILSTIRGLGGSPSQITVARALGISAASLSEALRSLARQGWLLQEANPLDKRAKILRLSAKGGQAFRTILKHMAEIDRFLIENANPEEIKIAIKVLKTANLELAKRLEDYPQKSEEPF